jgi:hypothetical protein
MVEMTMLGYRMKEPIDLDPEVPTTIRELFGYIVTVRGENEGKLKELLNLELEEMYQKYPIPRPPGLGLVKVFS